MKYRILRLPGDGIGPEVVAQAVSVLEEAGRLFRFSLDWSEAEVGGIAIEKYGKPLPDGVLEQAASSHAVLLGAVGGPKWDDPRAAVRPEQALLGLRKGLGLFANLRPVKVIPGLASASPIRPELLSGVDLVVVRELTGGIYFGEPSELRQGPEGRSAVDTLSYDEREIARVLRQGFELARKRRRKLSSVDKANILASSRLWREVAHEIAREYPDVEYEDILVDAMAMHLLRRPRDFDVIVTENMFGDILTDEASMLAGSLGMLPSASLGAKATAAGGNFGLYEPIHGSAPDIAGRDLANPLGTILSAALMLRHSLAQEGAARAIERAVENVIEGGKRTADIMAQGCSQVGCGAMGRLVREELKRVARGS